jgi:trehalose 6-phosphate phosphatase
VLAPLVSEPARTALLCDFDGTLAPIVDDPAAARPLDGVTGLLLRLSRRFAVVAVVSGRPAAFLAQRLAVPGGDGSNPPPPGSLRLVGLYGMESVDEDGRIRPDARVAPWLAAVAGAVDRLRDGAPDGVRVEPKTAAVTVHWRGASDTEDWVAVRVAEVSARTGLVPHPGRLSVELRPPLDIDKGTVVEQLTEGCAAACFLGDDLGDLPAFAALGRLAVTRGLDTVGVAVQDAEAAPEVAAVADLIVEGPVGAMAVLTWLDGASA